MIEKYIEGTTTPLKGVTFLVTDSSGEVAGPSNGEYITDENGRIVIDGLEPGTTVTARETKTLEGYVLDTTPKSIKIKTGEVQTLRFYNQQAGKVHSAPDPAAAAAVLNLLHHMGQIFRDNAPAPSNPMGVRMDSKRRKKLMEKRLALGHKMGDHENPEIQQTM